MQMFRSKKTKTEFISLNESFKDWKDASAEVEAMGNKLDSLRETIRKCPEDSWAHTYWTQIERTVFRKWQLMVSLQQGGLRQVGPSRAVPLDYTWWEGSDEISMQVPLIDGISRWMGERFGFSYSDLEGSWEKAKEEKLQKARQGLA